MTIQNNASLFAFANGLVCLLIYAFFLTPKQIIEVTEPKDWLTRLRWIILGILVLSVVSSLPSVLYQFYRMIGEEHPLLRTVATVTGQISKTCTTVLLVLVYTYKRKA